MNIESFLKQHQNFWDLELDDMTQGKVEEIIAFLKEKICEFPYSTSFYVHLGDVAKMCHFRGFTGDIQEAQYYYEKAIELDPLCYQAYEGLASILDVEGKLEDSKKLYEVAYILTNDMWVALGFAKILIQLDQRDEAQKIINDAKKTVKNGKNVFQR